MNEPRRQDDDETRRRFAALLDATKQRGRAPAGRAGGPRRSGLR